MERIYLDNNATTAVLPQVAEAIGRAFAAGYGNPASQHWAGRPARRALEGARESIAGLLGAECHSMRADQVIFTSGGTEANNLAVWGLADLGTPGARPGHAIISSIEHPSVVGAATRLQELGWEIDRLSCSAAGVTDVEQLTELLRPQTRLVSLVLGNNETGVLQPVARAAEICTARGVPLHTDAVQVTGKAAINFRALGVAAMTVSAHKFHGPVGVAALIVRDGQTITPLLRGGFQQAGLRPGTEPVALAIGMQVALEHWGRERDAISAHLASLRDTFEQALLAGWPMAVINGAAGPRLPHTSNVAFPGFSRQALMMALDLAGVACSTGSACASGSPEPSPTLVAMGCERSIVEGSLRFSFGQLTSREETLEAVQRILKVCNDLRSGKSSEKRALAGTAEGAILLE
jgi:cysteine desulfurase